MTINALLQDGMTFADYQELWSFAYQAYKGIGGFLNGGYLDKYTRESDDKFENRQRVAYYTNLFAPAVTRYLGYIWRDKPVRITDNKLLLQFIDDCDMRGNSLDVFMANFSQGAKVRGVGLVLVDMPKNLPATLAEQLEQRAIPFIREINPEDVLEFKLDNYGKFEYIAFRDYIDNSTFGNGEVIEVVKYFDKQGWQILYGEEILEQGEHNLGKCPVIYFSETGNFMDIGEFTQVAQLAKRHYNLKSELDELLRGQTFSLLTIQADNPDDITMDIGVNNALLYPSNLDRPAFISPDAAPANIYLEEIKKIEALIDKITYNFNTHEAQESGIALQLKFQGLNSSLNNFAFRLEDFERRIWDLVTSYLQIPYENIKVTYNKDFDITDLIKEINVLDSIKNMNYELPTYEKIKLQRIISNDLGSLDPETAAQIQAEIEDNLKR